MNVLSVLFSCLLMYTYMTILFSRSCWWKFYDLQVFTFIKLRALHCNQKPNLTEIFLTRINQLLMWLCFEKLLKLQNDSNWDLDPMLSFRLLLIPTKKGNFFSEFFRRKMEQLKILDHAPYLNQNNFIPWLPIIPNLIMHDPEIIFEVCDCWQKKMNDKWSVKVFKIILLPSPD